MFPFVNSSIRMMTMVALASTLLITPLLVDARDATPSSVPFDDDPGVFLRAGTCDKPGEIIDDIGDLDPGEEVWTVIGNHDAHPATVFGEDEGIDQTIDDLLTSDFVIAVHSSDDANTPMIACGPIIGAPDSDGTLMIELHEVGNSGFAGRAHFGPLQHEDESTEVTIGVWQSISISPIASPVASPVA